MKDQPPNPREARLRRRAVILLLPVFIFGLNAMFGQAWRNGYIDKLTEILKSNDPKVAVLPGSQTPVVRWYTGWRFLDNLFGIAAVLFTNVIDGSAPHLSLYGVHFGGQLVPIFAAIMIEGLRVGNHRNVFFYSSFCCGAMQTLGYGSLMPLYGIAHLMTSSAATGNDRAAIRPRYLAPLDPQAFIPAWALGYVVPTVLFSYPFESGALRQRFCAIWQPFPHWVVLIQYLIARNLPRPSTPTPKANSQDLREDARALSRIYNLTYNVAATVHLSVFAVIGSAMTFPQLFPRHMAETLTLTGVFRPGLFYSTQPMTSAVSAIHTFLLYDQYSGSTAALVWAVTLYAMALKRSMTWGDLGRLGWDIVRWTVVAGPGGALVKLLQRRDEAVLLAEEREVEKKGL